MVNVRLCMLVYMLLLHTIIIESISINFGLEIVWVMEKQIGYFLSPKNNLKAEKKGMKVDMEI